MTLDVTVYDPAAVMPIMDRSAAKQRYQAMVDFVGDILREGTDYGKVPGTGDKPALLKPGAEKLTTFFGLSKRFVLVKDTEDWTGKDHGGEPFFYYLYRCQLYRGDTLIAECDGSANSWESKYRYRKSERTCPKCGQATIIKGRDEYGGGWVCFAKKGGCGAKFKDGDATIEQQGTGRVLNPDPADVVNTLQKMSQKRALVGATLLAVNGSDYFTQDVEDYIEGDYSVTPAQPQPVVTKTKPAQPATNGTQAQPEQPQEPAYKTMTRPWPAHVAVEALQHFAGTTTREAPNNGQIGALIGIMDSAPHDTQKRHRFLFEVFGVESSKNLTGAQRYALLQWAKPARDDESGKWVMDANAAAEYAAIVNDNRISDAELDSEPQF